MIFGGSGSKLVWKINSLWKLGTTVSYKHVLWQVLGQLVKNKSMQLGLSGF